MAGDGKKALLNSAILLVILSLANKGLGFIKSITIASVFGATIQTDAYYIAEGLMQNVLLPVSDAIAVSFLPVYIGIREKGKEDAKAFASRTLTDIFLLAIILSAVLYILAPRFLHLLLPTYSAEEIGLTTQYFRILIWGMCFYMSNHMMQSLLNAEKQYGFSSFTAMLNNLILTFAVLLLGHRFGLYAMAVAVLISYMAQYVLLQIKGRDQCRLTVRYGFKDPRIKMLIINALPILLGNAVGELNQLVDKSLLSGMNEGAVTAVSYAAVLYQFALSLLSIPLTTIIYTELAESFAAGHMEEGGVKLRKGIHVSLFFATPITCFIVIASELIVQITYGRGAFSTAAVLMTAQGLRYYGLCFLPYCISVLLARACYSLGDTVLPMKTGTASVFLNIVLSITLSKIMGFSGIVLATSISSIFTTILILIAFNYTKLRIHLKSFLLPFVKVLISATASTLLCIQWLDSDIILNDTLNFIISAGVQFGSYAVFMILLKDEFCYELLSILKGLGKSVREE